jgi:ribosome recycling factor
MSLPAIEKKSKDFLNALDFLHKEFSGVRTGRASPALVETLQVESYGTKQPLKNIASISVSDAKTLVIQPWDRSGLQEIEKAIQASSIGIQPANDGIRIRLAMPPLSSERRQDLVKLIRQMAEQARVRIRNVREDVWKEVQKQVKDKQLTEDQKYQAEKELKSIVEKYNEEIKKLLESKENEVMTV